MRRDGRIPAVLYGGGLDSQSVAVDPKELSRLLHSQSGVNTLIALKVDGGEPTQVLVKEYQIEPTSHRLLHADFYRVAMDKMIEVAVPIHLKGEAKGVKLQGGMVDFVHRELEVECLPGDIPEYFEVDVSELVIGDGVRVRDLDSGGKWKALDEPDMLIVHVVAPRVEAEPEPEAEVVADGAAAPAEPEVIKKGKTDEPESGE